MHVLLMLAGLLGMLTIGGSVSASPAFLTLPFPGGQNAVTGDTAMNLQQGWYYTRGGLHQGIDYIEGTIDNSSTWQNFPIVAAADGEACGDTPTSKGTCVSAKDGGNRILIKHVINGQSFYTYYGHVNWIAPWIPLGDRNNTVHVTRGSQIGTAGDTGINPNDCSLPCVHLHFGVTPPNFSWLDPYGIYQARSDYPDPGGTNGRLSGTNNYWSGNPATYATGLRYNDGAVYDLGGYCQSLGYHDVSLDGNTAYDWHCVTLAGNRVGIWMASACDWQYQSRGLTALTKNYYDVNSWRCYGDATAR